MNSALLTMVALFSVSIGAALVTHPTVCECRLEGYWDGSQWSQLDCYSANCFECIEEDTGAGYWSCSCDGEFQDCICRTATTYAGGNPEDNCQKRFIDCPLEMTCKKLDNPPSTGWYVICNCRN